MSRPNQPRSIEGETALARRIADERQARVMSYESLAARMTSVGCAINASALFKIEKGTPRRRITVDELVALKRVFGLDLDDLVSPPELAQNEQLARLFDALVKSGEAYMRADEDYTFRMQETLQFLQAHPGIAQKLETASDFRIADLLAKLDAMEAEGNRQSTLRKES